MWRSTILIALFAGNSVLDDRLELLSALTCLVPRALSP